MVQLYPREIYIMKSKVSFCIFAMVACFSANAQDIELDNALRETYVNCVGIDDALHDMKVKAGINTAVTGVGTVAGGAALIVGIKKAHLMDKLPSIEDKYLDQYPQQTSDDLNITRNPNFKPDLKSKRKKLGNWRTGLLAVNTATNVAGATIAGTNKVKKPLEEQIDNCKTSVKNLKNEITRAKFNGEDVSEAQNIASACGEFEYTDLSKINNRAKGAEISSIVGAGTGFVGTITSAVANKSSGEKERKLDTASNVLAGGATVATGTATVFNATQIAAIKKVVDVAQKCESLLK